MELHLDQGAAGSGAGKQTLCSTVTYGGCIDKSTCVAAGSPGSDLKLARRLQREEEARQEKEDFKKLQVCWTLHDTLC